MPRPTRPQPARTRRSKTPLPIAQSSRRDNGGRTDYEQAYEALRATVLGGGFIPGEVLTLRALRNKLGLGIMPVREALKRLISEGAFEGLPNRSARVPTLKRREVEEILDLRRDLEGKAAYLAAKNVTMGQIESLRTLQEQMTQCVSAGDVRRYTELNMTFHFEIYRIAESPVLLKVIQALWLRMGPLLTSSVMLIARDRQMFDRTGTHSHEKIIDAFHRRDPSAAQAAMQEDLLTPTTAKHYWEAIEQRSGEQRQRPV
jgi:DNA-binding GntR family transcriptional regulator